MGRDIKERALADADAPDLDELERRMDGALASLKTKLASLRTGRASATMLDPVMVDAYGQATPLNQVGTITVPEPRMIVLNIWDKTVVGPAEKAIRNSGLGVNPVVDGTLIRIPIPELNEERRRELSKVAGGYGEDARIAIRNVRRDGMDQIKKAKSDGMPEDEQKLYSDEVQALTDKKIAAVDGAVTEKEKEIMQV
ncbi:MAG: ribosome recycling factor [Pseudomonadota bacterium]